MTYTFAKGDYIVFQRIVQPKKKCGFRTDYGTGRAVATPEIAEQVLAQSGDGCLVGHPIKRRVAGKDYTTARCAAAKPLGLCTVVLDDAVLSGKPLTMDLGIDAVDPQTAQSQYGTDAKGGA